MIFKHLSTLYTNLMPIKKYWLEGIFDDDDDSLLLLKLNEPEEKEIIQGNSVYIEPIPINLKLKSKQPPSPSAPSLPNSPINPKLKSKRPPSRYNLFFKEQFAILQKEHQKLPVQEIVKQIGFLWRTNGKNNYKPNSN